MTNAINFFKLDFSIIKGFLKSMLIFLVIIAIVTAFKPQYGANFLFIFILTLCSLPFSLESHTQISKLFHSLPGTTNEIVLGRYFFFIFSELAVWSLVGIYIVFAKSTGLMSNAETVLPILTGTVVSLLVLIQYPLYYKFGLKRGQILMMILNLFPMILVFVFPFSMKSAMTKLTILSDHLLIAETISVFIICILGIVSFMISKQIVRDRKI